MSIPLVRGTIRNEDIDNLIAWLKFYPRLTKDKLTIEFEEKFASEIGTKYAVFVNSGSSANLLMLSAVIEAHYVANKKAVIPALSWATDLAPVMQLGLQPILCDCNLDDLSVDLNYLEHIFKTQHPDLFIMVPVLGLVPNMDAVVKLCERHNVTLLEDCCEALKSTYSGRALGTYGCMSSFSLYYGHSISAIEGGVICTNNSVLANILKALRNHGWLRDCDADCRAHHTAEWHISAFDELYAFYYPGYNVRSTDLQAFLGLEQLKILSHVSAARYANYLAYQKYLPSSMWKPKQNDESRPSNFAYPIIADNREEIVKSLRCFDIECRPLIAGSLGRQPYYVKKYGIWTAPNADKVHFNGMYVPNNQDMKDSEIKFVCDKIANPVPYIIN